MSSVPTPPEPAAAASAALSADAALAAEERLLACHVRCVERLSPAAALLRTLRAWLDFAVFHTDWSCLSAPFEGHGALRAHHLQRRRAKASGGQAHGGRHGADGSARGDNHHRHDQHRKREATNQRRGARHPKELQIDR